MILHLALETDWKHAHTTGEYRISTLGRTLEEEGFIHCCANRPQLDAVAERYYRHITQPLLLLEIDDSDLNIRLETPPGAAEAFPHLYGPLPITSVIATHPYR